MTDYSPMQHKPDTPKVGVGVVFCVPTEDQRDHEVFLMKRRGSHGEGTWGLPGGHMEVGEDFLTCCKREVEEETGVELLAIEALGFGNGLFEEEGLHYVTLFFRATDWKGEPKCMEPDKCEEIGWFPFDDLPSPIFGPFRHLLQNKNEWRKR
jgi:8-oxo-dGTP diphosphatase